MTTVGEHFTIDELKKAIGEAFIRWYAERNAKDGGNVHDDKEYWRMSCIQDCVMAIVDSVDIDGISVYMINRKLWEEANDENAK